MCFPTLDIIQNVISYCLPRCLLAREKFKGDLIFVPFEVTYVQLALLVAVFLLTAVRIRRFLMFSSFNFSLIVYFSLCFQVIFFSRVSLSPRHTLVLLFFFMILPFSPAFWSFSSLFHVPDLFSTVSVPLAALPWANLLILLPFLNF